LAGSQIKKNSEGEEARRWREKEVDETAEKKSPIISKRSIPYSMTHKHGPVIIRMRNRRSRRRSGLAVADLIWRSAEFQEREISISTGIRFEGHPDLRRILMWDEFVDYPMRKITRAG